MNDDNDGSAVDSASVQWCMAGKYTQHLELDIGRWREHTIAHFKVYGRIHPESGSTSTSLRGSYLLRVCAMAWVLPSLEIPHVCAEIADYSMQRVWYPTLLLCWS